MNRHLAILSPILLLLAVAVPAEAQFCCQHSRQGGCWEFPTDYSDYCRSEMWNGTPHPGATCDEETGMCRGEGVPSTTTTTLPGGLLPPLTKDDRGHRWGQDPLIRYDLTVRNPDATARSIVVRETVPANTTFSAADSTPGWTCTPGPAADSECLFQVDELAPGASRVVVFAVRVLEGTDPAVDIFNEATASAASGAASSAQPGGLEPQFSVGLAQALACTVFDECNPRSDDFDPIACCWVKLVIAATQGLDGLFACLGGGSPVLLGAPTPRAGTARAAVPAGKSMLLYQLRDRVFRRTPGGRRATQLYYKWSPDLVRAGLQNRNLVDLAGSALVAWLTHLEAVARGQGDTVTVTQAQLAPLNAFLDALRPVASAGLAEVMDRERPLIDLDSWLGITATEALARLDRLSCDRAADLASIRCRLDELGTLMQGRVQGATANRLLAALAKAKARAGIAEASTAQGNAKKARAAYRKMGKLLAGFQKRLRSKKGARDASAVRDALLATSTGVQADLKTLQGG